MKQFKRLFQCILPVIMGILALASCDICDDDNNKTTCINDYPNALVTIKPTESNGSFFLWVDSAKSYIASNIKTSPYGAKEVRALAYLKDEGLDNSGNPICHVFWMDSIRTKSDVVTNGTKQDSTLYGNDPIEIINDWTTVAEDGYLTLRFRTLWGNNGTKHEINLITGTNPDNPYEVVLRQNANKDITGQASDGIIAFRLNHIPDTKNKYVDLTLKWNSYSGIKTAKFRYKTRNDNYYNK